MDYKSDGDGLYSDDDNEYYEHGKDDNSDAIDPMDVYMNLCQILMDIRIIDKIRECILWHG